MFDCSKGISSSALPYKRTSPSWLKISSPEVTNFTLHSSNSIFTLIQNFWICFRLMRLFASLLRRVWLLLRSVLFFVILTALLRSRALPAAKSFVSSKLTVSLYAVLYCFGLLGLVWINRLTNDKIDANCFCLSYNLFSQVIKPGEQPVQSGIQHRALELRSQIVKKNYIEMFNRPNFNEIWNSELNYINKSQIIRVQIPAYTNFGGQILEQGLQFIWDGTASYSGELM